MGKGVKSGETQSPEIS